MPASPSARRAAQLPAQPGPLVGREADIDRTVEHLLRPDVRLLSLVGAGGAGKTRLAIEVAARVGAAFPDGAHFVDLSPITDTGSLIAAVARVLDIRERRDQPLIELVEDTLAPQQPLIVLDNFEQLLPASAQLARLLEVCPGLKLLVTTRSALHLRWEHVLTVPPLQVPNLEQLPELDALARVPSVALFTQRAQRVYPGFELTRVNARAVAELCVRLDGLPLAIELAAARVHVLPPRALLKRLDERLDLLATTNLDQPRRQRTMRAAIDASYDLLTPFEQALFRRLAVFVGGFPLDAVAEVCDPHGLLGPDPLSGVESLVNKSLLRQESSPHTDLDTPRFGMLETIREYALERLTESGEHDDLRRQHAAYYLSGADVVVGEIKSTQQAAWLRSLDGEHDNLLAALAWCHEVREPELGLRASGLLAWFWLVRGHVLEGRARLTALLEVGGRQPTALRAEALRVTGSLALNQADYPSARQFFGASLAIGRELGDRASCVGALSGLGATAMQEGDVATAEACFQEALSTQAELGDKLGLAESLNSLANIAHGRGDLARARELYRMSQSLNSEIGYRTDVVLHNLGVVAQEQGDLPAARQLFQDSVAIKRAIGDPLGVALSLAKLGEVTASSGDVARAHQFLSESLVLQYELGDRPGVAFVLERFAMTAAAHGQPGRALHLAGAADELRRAIGMPLSEAAQASLDAWLEPATGALPVADVQAALADGRAMSLDDVIAFAMSIAQRDADDQTDGQVGKLSPREREVAILLAEGCTNRQIAERLVVSERTAENHVQRLMNRLGLRSRTQVAAWAVRCGLSGDARK